MLKESCIIQILRRMRGGEVLQGRRKAYRRDEERIQQLKANYERLCINVRLCINNKDIRISCR